MSDDQSTDDASGSNSGFTTMGKSRMEELQDTMTSVLSKVIDGTLDLERAKTANEVFRSLISSAKVETEFFKTNKIHHGQAMCMPRAVVEQKQVGGSTVTSRSSPNGMRTVVHQLGG